MVPENCGPAGAGDGGFGETGGSGEAGATAVVLEGMEAGATAAVLVGSEAGIVSGVVEGGTMDCTEVEVAGDGSFSSGEQPLSAMQATTITAIFRITG